MTRAQDAEPRWFLQNLLFVHVRGADVGGRFGLIELWGPPGDQPPPHVHREQDEGFYVIEGEVTLHLPDREVTLGPGQFFNAPAAVPHTYVVTSDQMARFLVTSCPAGAEAFIEEFSSPALEFRLPTIDGPPDVPRLVELAAKHGIDILGPPGMLPKDLAAHE